MTERNLRLRARWTADERKRRGEKESTTRRRAAAILGILKKDPKEVKSAEETARTQGFLMNCSFPFP